MLTIHLFTRAGDEIHTARIPAPPHDDMPDVIVWGARLFVVPDINGPSIITLTDGAYVEALVFQLPASSCQPTGAVYNATGGDLTPPPWPADPRVGARR
jgi:hypothetical protein